MPPSDDPWAAFVAELERVAATDVTVLLVGESGSGKSRAAARLHALGPRKEGPLVSVHLAGLAPSLLEAELFGHAEGAFTGAVGSRIGRFERAAGGTVVLEGVETLDPGLQVKLLRVLQERVVEPLGAEEAVPIDVRVVATTARDLRAAVDEGSFREDLYYRLAVVSLEVPPLRARGDRVRELVGELTAEVAARLGAPPRAFEPEALDRLVAHPWPGNVRELENALERVLALAPAGGGGPVPVAAEELDFLDEARRGVADELARSALAAGVDVDELTRAVLQEALRETRGNVAAASRRVGLSRRAFEYRMSKLGATPPDDQV